MKRGTSQRRSRTRGRNQKITISLTKREAVSLGALLLIVLCGLMLAVGYFGAKAMQPPVSMDDLLAWEKNRLETVGGIYNDLSKPSASVADKATGKGGPK